jgi:hypothetical protein
MRPNDIVGIKEIAEQLGRKPQTAALWRHRGLLPKEEGSGVALGDDRSVGGRNRAR